MHASISPGQHHFSATISRGDNPQASRRLTVMRTTWAEAHEYFTQQLVDDQEYIMDCCDDTLCQRLEPEPEATPPQTET